MIASRFKDLEPRYFRSIRPVTALGSAVKDKRFFLRPLLLRGIIVSASVLVLARLGLSVEKLVDCKPDDFLAFPLTVVLPFAALFFLVRMRSTRTSEGALMRLAALALILMILGVPNLALHLALGFPIAFLVVELFETRIPASLRDAIKRRLIV